MDSVLIGMPTGGTVRIETMTSVIGAMNMLKQKGIDVDLYGITGGYVAHNRNKIVAQAQDKGFSHIMFIDNDMVFPPSGIVRLLDHDKDIVAGMYNTRGNLDQNGKVMSTVKLLDENGEMPTDGRIMNFEIPNRLFKVGGLGTGFMLVKTAMFGKLKKPYFVAWESEDGDHHTEDIEFCIRARKVGVDVWCSPTIQIGHIGTQIY